MIVALVGQKGGSGKSTTATCLADEWCRRRRRRVLLVDADPQGSSVTWAEVGGAELGGVELGDTASAAGDRPVVVALGAEMHRPDQLPRLAQRFDVTVIDCPPRHDAIQRAALMVADLALLPCGPTPMDAWALSESVALVRAAQALRPQLRAAVLITRKLGRSLLVAGAREVLGQSGLPLLHTELGLRVAFQEAAAAGQGVTRYAPRSAAATELRALARELERLATPSNQELADAAA